MQKTRGELEAAFTRAIIQMEKEYLGRGPLEARTFFVDDMIIVRLRGVLTPAEKKLAESNEGRLLIKETRRQLFETSRDLLGKLVKDTIGCTVLCFHSDMSTRTGERVLVLTVDNHLDQLYR
ncbi:MAG: DUF2294 domain-containing protein [Anaerolineales bacterium]|nr:DUF2294 domain-containing protein [Anaerolineales bacterium]